MDWEIRLPGQYARLENEYRAGRRPYDGFVRGFGIEKGNVEELCDADPLFNEAFRLSAPRSYLYKNALMNLYMLLRFYLPSLPFGHVAEFGTYRGGSAMFMAHVAARCLPGVRVFAFDTFTGMPAVDAGIDAHLKGDFSDVDVEEVRAYAAAAGLDNIAFVPGRFAETAPAVLGETGGVALAHIDCDIYSSVAEAYTTVKDHLVEGAYVVFDDPLHANCLSALEAVEDHVIAGDGLRAEQAYPHLVYRRPAGETPSK